MVCSARAAFGQAVPPLSRAVPIDGEPFSARIERIEPDWTVHWQTDGGPRATPVQDVVRWGDYTDSFRLMQILLTDGSLLVAEIARLADDKLIADGEICGRVEIPLAKVRGVVLDPPPSISQRDELWERITTSQGVEDQLVLRNGDVLRGVLKKLEPSESTAATALAVTFAVEGRDLTIPASKAQAIVFNPALVDTVAKPGFYARMGFRDGSLLHVAQLSSAGPLTQVKLASTVSLAFDTEFLQTELTLLQPSSDRVVYLSDLEPISYKHIAYLETAWPLGRDRSTTGARLRHGGHLYTKGLGMHSASRVAYRLDGRYRRLQAELALDDSAGLGGNVIFRVFLADAADQWKRAYESPIVRGGDPALPISVDVSQAQALALIVDFADRGDVLDRAAWLDARLTK
ncbi:MAG TPA: NPCBM/NEW2 domain-containing protein [Candidatus Anammoximicrobium sp.]|nr:NPCBM/NEW2 domain-containing protein [Candidatus Anammoximicrobium sp.]